MYNKKGCQENEGDATIVTLEPSQMQFDTIQFSTWACTTDINQLLESEVCKFCCLACVDCFI